MIKFLLCTLFLFSTAYHSFGAVFPVSNTDDSGQGSLRQAIIDATANDTVAIDTLLLAYGSDTIQLNSEISINKPLVINGLYTSFDTLFISGQNNNRIFNINVNSGTLELNGLCFTKGNIGNGGALTISGSATVEIENCIFLNNEATTSGGAIYKSSGGTLTVNNSTFIGNTAQSGGGAINLFATNVTDFTYCTFKQNVAGGSGGGIYAFGTTNVNTTNCTFTENEGSSGGAIYSGGSSAILDVINCTIINNVATSSAAGVYHFGSSIVFTMGSSVVVGNTGAANVNVIGAGASSTSLGYNVIGDASLSGGVATDQLSVTPGSANLGSLQDNGGRTFTMMPGTGSVAIDAGEPSDMSDAQNGEITDGARDAGSAENYSCPIKYSSFYKFTCDDYTVPSGDETYTLSTGHISVNDTITNACGTDSVMTIIIVYGDTIAPVADAGSLQDVNSSCEVQSLTAPTATDNCAGAVTATTTTTFPISASGTTVVTWTYDDGNGNTSTQDQNVIITPLDTSVTQNQMTLSSNATNVTYQWVNCNNNYSPIADENSQDFTATDNGSYAVVISDGSCTDTSACFDLTQAGLKENNLVDVNVFPNPTQGKITIQSPEYTALSVEIYSPEGKVIMEEQGLTSRKQQLDLTGVSPGVYLVAIKDRESSKVIRISVQ